jgi:hypothetical protein
MRHPTSSLATKIEIWKEIEGKREYRAQNLIGKLELGAQDRQKTILEKEYSKLSQRIHFGHKQVIATLKDLSSEADVDDGVPARIDCSEVGNILVSLKTAFDIFFLLLIVRFTEIKEELERNSSFLENIKKFKLPILCEVFNLSY